MQANGKMLIENKTNKVYHRMFYTNYFLSKLLHYKLQIAIETIRL